jgi:hypothetical protein
MVQCQAFMVREQFSRFAEFRSLRPGRLLRAPEKQGDNSASNHGHGEDDDQGQ